MYHIAEENESSVVSLREVEGEFYLEEESSTPLNEKPFEKRKVFRKVPPALLKELKKDYGPLKRGATRIFPKKTGPQITEVRLTGVTLKNGVVYKGRLY